MLPLCKNQREKTDCITEIALNRDELIAKKSPKSTKCTERVFLVAGRLVYRKGHELLLDALSLLPDDLQYRCNIVGDGPMLEKLKAKNKVAGIGGAISNDTILTLKKLNGIIDRAETRKIIFDVSGEEKKKLTIEQLLQMFEKSSGSRFTSDKVMLSK